MSFLRYIWRKLIGLFRKRSPTIESIIFEEKSILAEAIENEIIYAKIREIEDDDEKTILIKKIARQEVAKEILEFVEKENIEVEEKKKGRKKFYELYELRAELLELEERKATLELAASKIFLADYPNTLSIGSRIDALHSLLTKNKIENQITLSPISISSFDISFQQLEKILSENSVLHRYRNREAEKERQKKIYEDKISKELNKLDSFISQDNFSEAHFLIKTLSNSIKPNYKKHLIRLNNCIDKLKEKELNVFRKQQEELLKKQAVEAERIRIQQEKLLVEQRILREQEAAKRKHKEELKTEKERKLKALLTKKSNWRDFQKVLQANGITAFYHFTDIQNLKSIRDNKGLFSWHYADSNEIIINFPGGDALSRDLDKRYGLQDYVRVSFCRDHPMQYRLTQRGRYLALLRVDIEVAYYENTIFCDINAADSGHQKGTSLNDLERIRFSATKRDFVRRDDPDFKHHQAEVLVKTWIPLEHITNIKNYGG